MIKKTYLLTACILALVSAAVSAQSFVEPVVPKTESKLIDNFEDGNYWLPANSDWNQYGEPKVSIDAYVTTRWHSEGKYSLECTMEKSGMNTTRSGIWYCDNNMDWTGYRYVVMDVYNPENFVFTIQLAAQATNNWNWCQSGEYYFLPHGVHTLTFDISQFGEDNLKEIKRILVMHNGGVTPAAGKFYIDNVRLYK